MKKLTFSFLIASLVLTYTSCTQEYICQCVVKYKGVPPGIPDTAVHEFTIKNTKKVATSECEANSVLTTENGITMDEKCQLY